MLPYYEFYSDMDLLLGQIEEMIDKCNDWWNANEPFCDDEGHEESSDRWSNLRDELSDILATLNNEPFYTSSFENDEPF